MNGWAGHILNADLTTGTLEKTPLDPEAAKLFLGGRGLNAKTLFDAIKPGIDPLGPDNILCLAAGVLTATTLGLSSRLQVSTLSPYSGILGDGNAGGTFAHVMKKAGYDQIVISGRSQNPVYLYIENDGFKLLDADDLWGKNTWETTDILMEKHGKDISVATIGQAGENLVRSASTIIDKYASAARGSGAVWGAKRLKAIAVKGTGTISLYNRKAYFDLSKQDHQYLAKDKVQQETASVYGSHYGMTNWYPGYRNFEKELSSDQVPNALRPEAWKAYEVGRAGCHGCQIKCKNVYKIPSGPRKGEIGEALEYECIYCLGTNCGIEDPVAILEMENLADMYGVDVIAIGNTIALAKDLYNRGIITKTDTGGLALEWENADAQIELIHKTVLRQGFGNLVAEGLYNMAKLIGKEAMKYCYHVKGLSRGPHPPGLYSLAHAISSRGADHLRGRSWGAGDNSEEDILKGLVAEKVLSSDPVPDICAGEQATVIADAIGRCKGAVNTWTCAVPLSWKKGLFNGLAKLLEAATGVAFDSRMIETAAARIHTLERAFNVRQGISFVHDTIPQKPDISGSVEGERQKKAHVEMVRNYYRAHGWNIETGIPERETLKRLSMASEADRLESGAPYTSWDGPLLWPLDRYPSGGQRA